MSEPDCWDPTTSTHPRPQPHFPVPPLLRIPPVASPPAGSRRPACVFMCVMLYSRSRRGEAVIRARAHNRSHARTHARRQAGRQAGRSRPRRHRLITLGGVAAAAGRHGVAAELCPCGEIAAWTRGFGVCMQTWSRVKEEIDFERERKKESI